MDDSKNNNSDNESCCLFYYMERISEYWNLHEQNIAAKMGFALSILNSIFLIIDTYYPASIAKYVVAGTISAGVFIGSLCYQRIVDQYKVLEEKHEQLETDHISLKQSKDEIIRRYTLLQQHTPNSTTPQSVDSIEPINFEQIHKNNKLNDYTFPTE